MHNVKTHTGNEYSDEQDTQRHAQAQRELLTAASCNDTNKRQKTINTQKYTHAHSHSPDDYSKSKEKVMIKTGRRRSTEN